MARHDARPYRPTEAKYKGGADDMYVTYDLEQKTRGGTAVYPKVKRIYIAGDVKNWDVGTFTKKSGRTAHGVKIQYAQTRSGYQRRGFTATRGATRYHTLPARVEPAAQTFTQIVEVPNEAQHIAFHRRRVPARYRAAVQDVR